MFKDIFINHNDNLVDISGFNSLTSAGPFYLTYNNNLTNISGLSSLSALSCLYITNNNSLPGLSGFAQLESINNELLIYQNNNISDLNGLQNLSFIGIKLDIRENPQIVSLSGIDSVDLSSIYGLRIKDNPLLSTCAITSICDLLDNSTASIDIENNAVGCNSQEEVEEACLTGENEMAKDGKDIKIFPNPAIEELFISSDKGVKINKINIYNQVGRKVLDITEPVNYNIDVSELSDGLYIIEIVTVETQIREKLIIR